MLQNMMGGGEKPCGKNNYWGIMEKVSVGYKCRNFNSLEDAIKGVKKYTGKYYNQLFELGVTEESVNKVFIGSYCTSSCQHWSKNFLLAYKQQ